MDSARTVAAVFARRRISVGLWAFVQGGGVCRLPVHSRHLPAHMAITTRLAQWPATWRIEDLAIGLKVLAGPDPRDPYAFPTPLLNYADVKIENLRIVFWTECERCQTTNATRETVGQAAAALGEANAKIEKLCPPHWDKTGTILQAVYESEVTTFEDVLKEFDISNPTAVDRQAVAFAKSHWEKMPADEAKRALDEWLPMFQIAMLEFFEKYDALLLPVSAGPAVLLGESWNQIYDFDFTLATSLVPKVPAGSIRCGWSPENLPIGVQVVTKPYREDIALAIMRQLETDFEGWKTPPERNFVSS